MLRKHLLLAAARLASASPPTTTPSANIIIVTSVTQSGQALVLICDKEREKDDN